MLEIFSCSFPPLQRSSSSCENGKKGTCEGFTYVAVMFAVILIGLAASTAAQQWKTIVLREKEAELLFRGGEIRRAIFTYCQTSRPGILHCPTSLENLIQDPGAPGVKRYLRKLYKDPITNEEFELIMHRDKRSILGVRSTSEDAPLKVGDFPPEFRDFEGKTMYSEWEFICNQYRLNVAIDDPHVQVQTQATAPPPQTTQSTQTRQSKGKSGKQELPQNPLNC